MALLEEQFTETLDAGAPDITYQGNEGKEQQIARSLWDQLPNEVRMQFGSFEQFFQSGAWKEVLAKLQEAQQQVPERIQETETIEEQPQQGLAGLMPAQMAYGGVAGPDGRRAYGWGSKFKKAFKKITKPIKKIVKSPIGKAAAAYGLGTFLGGTKAFGGTGNLGFFDRLKNPGLLRNLITPSGWSDKNLLNPLVRSYDKGAEEWGGASLAKVLGGAATLAPFAMQAMGKWDTGEQDLTKLTGGDWDFDYSGMRKELADAALTGNQDKVDLVLAKYNLSAGDMPGQPYWKTMAQGGRIGYALGAGVESLPVDQMEEIEGQTAGPAGYHRILEEQMSLLAEELDKHPSDLSDSEYELAGNRAMEIWRSGGFAQGGRIGYAEGGWEAREKQNLISKLVNMGLPLPQAMKMAEMIIANATPEELQSAIAGTQQQKLTPEESIKFQETIETPTEDISVTDRVSEYLPDIPRYKPMKGEYMRGSMQRPEISEMVMEQLRTPKLRETIGEIKEKLPEWTRDAELVPGMNEGGLMSLGGMEMDLRGGGFVPLGAQEKADDVPARLSKNEFVFTADAVRAAGDGNVDKGADKMYKTMKQLESRVG
jgi:hypothetical protein